jgi:hypothetical protein
MRKQGWALFACCLALALFALTAAGVSSRGLAWPSTDTEPSSDQTIAVPVRTPLPDGLYPYPEQRVGFVAFWSNVNFSALNAGFVKLEHRGPTAYERTLGVDFCTVILEDTEHWELPHPASYWAKIAQMVGENPGHLWFVGNEPDNPCRFGTHSGEYVQRYHKLYEFIKERDPTAQVGIGGVVIPSEIRRTWLERVLAAYQGRYGEPMPIDVWSVHDLLLSECPGECGCPPGGPCEELCCSGGYVPRELWCQKGLYYSLADQTRSDEFIRLLVEFRQWMKDQGLQDKPLIVTEMGVLPWSYEGGCPGCYPHDEINRFMFETFDFMMNTRDPQIGYPADDYRLVQRWTWYSLDDWGRNGILLDTQFQPTDFGLNFANYIARFLPASPTTIFFQRGWTGYTEDCDTTLRPSESSPRGDRIWVSENGNQRGLLQFDVSILPTNVEVISATLRLFAASCSDPAGVMVNAYGIKRPWVISEATWLNATAGTAWEVPGCGGETDREMAPTSSVNVTSGDTYYTLDMTALARRWVADPSTNHGLLLQASLDGSAYCTFTSSDQTEDPPYWKHRQRPKLELVVRLPEAAATATPTPTVTATEVTTPTATATPTTSATGTPTELATPTATSTAGAPAYQLYLPVLLRGT